MAAHRGGERLEHPDQAQSKHLKRDYAGHGDERGDQPIFNRGRAFFVLEQCVAANHLVLSLGSEARGGGVERVLMGGRLEMMN